jgi:hypothetical protein
MPRMKKPYGIVPQRHFSGLANVTPKSGDVDLASVLNARATVTTEDVHVYANGTSGDDTNDGLTPQTPKKTIQAAFDLIPTVLEHTVIVHLSGVFTETVLASITSVYSGLKVGSTRRLVVDGGLDLTVVDNNGGANYTTTGSSAQSLVVAAAGWTTNEHRGYIVEILTGAAAGEQRLVHSNDGTTVVPMKDFSVDPGTGATFHIVRPATTLNCHIGPYYCGLDRVQLQNLYFTSGKAPRGSSVWGTYSLSHIICEDAEPTFADVRNFSIVQNTYDADTGDSISGGTAAFGMAFRSSSKITFRYCQSFNGMHSVLVVGDVVMSGGLVTNYLFDYGTSIVGKISARNLSTYSEEDGNPRRFLGSSSGFQPTTVTNAGGVGLFFKHCDVLLLSGTIENCGSHAIEAHHSLIKFTGAVAGTGNTGAGLYIHSGSYAHITNGTPPTVTGGTPGDVSFDGTSEASSWATIDAGTPATDTTEMSAVKEV